MDFPIFNDYNYFISASTIFFTITLLVSFGLFYYFRKKVKKAVEDSCINEEAKKEQLKNSFMFAKNYSYGFLCGLFIILLEVEKNEKYDFVFLWLGIIILIFIASIIEEYIKLADCRTVNHFIENVDGIFINLIPAVTIFVLNHFFIVEDLTEKDVVISLILISLSFIYLSFSYLVRYNFLKKSKAFVGIVLTPALVYLFLHFEMQKKLFVLSGFTFNTVNSFQKGRLITDIQFINDKPCNGSAEYQYLENSKYQTTEKMSFKDCKKTGYWIETINGNDYIRHYKNDKLIKSEKE